MDPLAINSGRSSRRTAGGRRPVRNLRAQIQPRLAIGNHVKSLHEGLTNPQLSTKQLLLDLDVRSVFSKQVSVDSEPVSVLVEPVRARSDIQVFRRRRGFGPLMTLLQLVTVVISSDRSGAPGGCQHERKA
jgi:hypothetical protein